MQSHAALNSSLQCSSLVAGKIISPPDLQNRQKTLDRFRIAVACCVLCHAFHVGVTGISHDDFRHFLHRQHIVGNAGSDGAEWHAVELCC